MIHPYTYAGLSSDITLAPLFSTKNHKYLFDKLCSVVEETIGVSKVQITHGSRERINVDARKIITYIMKSNTNVGLTGLGVLMNKNHATVLHQFRSAENLLSVDQTFQKSYNLVILAFENQLNKP